MNLTLIIRNWEEGLVSTGEALAQVLCSETIVERRLEAIATIALKLQTQEQIEADKAEHEMSILKHGPHGKRCLCSDCNPPEEYETSAYDEEMVLVNSGYHNSHVAAFCKHYGF